MKVEFNDNSYKIGNHRGLAVCNGCIMNRSRDLKCPTDSEGNCILSLTEIYTNLCANQIFKL